MKKNRKEIKTKGPEAIENKINFKGKEYNISEIPTGIMEKVAERDQLNKKIEEAAIILERNKGIAMYINNEISKKFDAFIKTKEVAEKVATPVEKPKI